MIILFSKFAFDVFVVGDVFVKGFGVVNFDNTIGNGLGEFLVAGCKEQNAFVARHTFVEGGDGL